MIAATATAPTDLERRIADLELAIRLAEYPETVQVAAIQLAALRAQKRRAQR